MYTRQPSRNTMRDGQVSQQSQTYEFFKGHADEWQKKAGNQIYAVIRDRHRAVHEVLSKFPAGSSLFDVGCGTGQLAIEAFARGYSASGIDFAEEMIEICRRNAAEAKADVAFDCVSVFDFEPAEKFDVISAQGFIEYISTEQLTQLLHKLHDMTADGGAIAIGSRNRLFNLTSLNEFTEMERKLGTTDALLEESLIISMAESQEAMIEALRGLSANLVQPESHPMTHIGVQTRYQFTPSDLIKRIEDAGFEVTTLYPVHFHAMMPTFFKSEGLKEPKDRIAEEISINHHAAHRALPASSSYVVEAYRK